MQSVSPNYDRKCSQTDKITEKNLSQKLYLVSIAKNKDPSIRVKIHQTFLTNICLISVEWM